MRARNESPSFECQLRTHAGHLCNNAPLLRVCHAFLQFSYVLRAHKTCAENIKQRVHISKQCVQVTSQREQVIRRRIWVIKQGVQVINICRLSNLHVQVIKQLVYQHVDVTKQPVWVINSECKGYQATCVDYQTLSVLGYLAACDGYRTILAS